MIGTDASHSLINELNEYLQYARNHQIFIFLCLWNGADRGNTNARLEGLIKDTNKLHSYINHALVPMVKALKDQPALAGWDIINEMEGVINPNLHSREPCFDTTFLRSSGAGWKGHIYSAQELLRFVWWGFSLVLKPFSDSVTEIICVIQCTEAATKEMKQLNDKFKYKLNAF